MSLFGVMGTSISGMAAQASRLGTVGDNIANSGTTGYKRADSQFETLLGNNSSGGTGAYDSGGVQTVVRYATTEQGALQGTTAVTNLAIQGNGFFLVNSPAGTPALSRAGAFVPDSSGYLVNTAGYYLMGYDLTTNPTAANGIDGLTKVNVAQAPLQAIPSTTGTLTANLPSTAAVVPAPLPSSNDPAATYTEKTSLVAYDNVGTPVNLDVYISKTSATDWEVTVYNKADAASGGGFPYAAGPLDSKTLTFDPTTGKLASGSATALSVTIPNGATPLPIDLSRMTQLASDYSVSAASTNGSAPSAVDHIEISDKGVLTSVYANGARVDNFKIPLATVASTANLTSDSGDVYEPNADSGPILLGSSNTAGYGSIASSSLEQSNVDLATELSNMIVAQRSYEANSKVFQTGAELLHVLTQLNT